MWHFNTHLNTHRPPRGAHGRTEVFAVTDSRSGMYMTGGGQTIDKRAKALSEKGLKKGWRDRRKDWSPAVSTPERSLAFSLRCPVFFLNLCTPPLLTCWLSSSFVIFLMRQNTRRPSALRLCWFSHRQIKTICCLKTAFWIQRQKMEGRQRAARVLWGNVAPNV